jgi:hypothetical protein
MREVIPFSDEIRKVLRGTAPSILKEYFDGRKLFQDVDLIKEEEKGLLKFITLMFEKIQNLQPEKLREEVKSDLHRIYVMQNSKSLLPVIRELKNVEDQIIEFIDDSEKAYDQTFTLFLKNNECFTSHYLVHGDGKAYKRWWSVRTDYVQKDFDLSEDLVKKLFSEAKRHLLSEGMGKHYHMHRKPFGSKEQIVIFYQHLLEEKPELQNKKIDMRFSRPIKKIVFLYDKKRGFVKTFNEDEVRIEAHRLFARIIFGKETIPSGQPQNRVCKLDKALEQLVSRGEILFVIPQNLNISKITLISAVFMDSEVVLKLSSRRNKAIYTSLKKNLERFFKLDESSENAVQINALRMTEIEFRVDYRDFFSKKTYRSKRIAMSSKNSISNLSEEDVDFEILDCFRGAGILEIGKC